MLQNYTFQLLPGSNTGELECGECGGGWCVVAGCRDYRAVRHPWVTGRRGHQQQPWQRAGCVSHGGIHTTLCKYIKGLEKGELINDVTYIREGQEWQQSGLSGVPVSMWLCPVVKGYTNIYLYTKPPIIQKRIIRETGLSTIDLDNAIKINFSILKRS